MVSKSALIIFRVVQVKSALHCTLHEGSSLHPEGSAMQSSHRLLGLCHSSSSAAYALQGHALTAAHIESPDCSHSLHRPAAESTVPAAPPSALPCRC